jgi:hypothetical protein
MSSKHFFLLWSAAFLSASIVRPLAASDSTFGVKAGFSFATISDPSSDVSLGLTAGCLVSLRLNERFCLQPELDIIQKGEGDVKIRCLEVPVLLKFRFKSEGSMTPSLLAGPYLAFKIHSSGDTADLYDFERPDFGIALGGAMDFKVGRYALIFDLRYDFGITEVDHSVWTRTLIATVGIGF